MNRLWVRLSIAFSSVVLISMIALFAAPILLNRAGILDRPGPPAELLPAELQTDIHTIREALLRRLTLILLPVAIGGTLIGIGASVWMSRSLTAPLEELAGAARSIGARDLSRRVVVRGSCELIEVGTAFNQMAADLEQAERLRSNLLADVAHELRTPLTVLQGNLRAMLDDVYAMDKEEISRLYDQTRHLSRLVEDLHELSQAEARQLPLDLQEIDIVAHINSIAALFQPIAAAVGVQLTTEIPDVLPRVRVDADRLTQALHNILSNALRHTPDGGSISLCASELQDEICIAVEDTGSGIAPEHLEHIFDRFYRTDQSRTRDTGGTGLGLAIVKAIIEAHDGRVTVASEGLGEGATVRAYFPTNF